MKLKIEDSFSQKLDRQVDFIAGDKPEAAKKIKAGLIRCLKKIPKNPWINRKSYYFDDVRIRDYIFKGYTIIYKIEDSAISVFGFLKWEEDYYFQS